MSEPRRRQHRAADYPRAIRPDKYAEIEYAALPVRVLHVHQMNQLVRPRPWCDGLAGSKRSVAP
jgi:hypothetical protein